MKNKIISLSLIATIFLSSTAQASSAMSDAMINITKPGSYTEHDSSGNVKSHNIYTGGVAYRFQAGSYPPPLYAVSPPSIQANCNGLNLKGMFVSLLGLDQLGAMLQNAGASLAWGIAIGLIYSLPGVASAFKMINEWATKIQQLLGNACNSGIAMGKWLGEKGYEEFPMANSVKTKVENPSSTLQEGTTALLTAVGVDSATITNMGGTASTWANNIFNFGGTNKIPSKDSTDAFTSMYKGLFTIDNSIGGTLLHNLYQKNMSNNALRSEILDPLLTSAETMNKAKLIIVDGNGIEYSQDATSNDLQVKLGIDKLASYYPNLNEQRATKLNFFAYTLLYNLVGDIGMTSLPSASEFKEIQAVADGNSTAEQQKALASRLTYASHVSNTKALSAPGALKTPTESAKSLASFLWYGTQSSTPSSSTKTESTEQLAAYTINKDMLKAPILTIIAYTQPASANKFFIPILESNPAKEEPFTPTDFKGAYTSSECVINSLVNGNATAPSATCGLGLVFHGVDRYIRTIKNSPKEDQDSLINMLISYNALATSEGILMAMSNSLQGITGNSSKPIDTSAPATPTTAPKTDASSGGSGAAGATNSKASETLQYLDRVESLIKETTLILSKEYAGNQFTINDLQIAFDNQDARNRARGLKSIQNK